MNREYLINDFIRHCADLFPYNDPNYETKLIKAAEHYADEVLNPDSDFNKLCKEHDNLLNEN